MMRVARGLLRAVIVVVLRVLIVAVAGLSIWEFADGFLLAWETLAHPLEAGWFNVLSALCEGLVGQ